MTPTIIDVDDIDEKINMLVYGNSGVGKTAMLGNCKALILATETGVLTIKRMKMKAKVIECKDWNDAKESIEFLIDGGYKDYDWIGVDSLTDFQTLAMKGIVSEGVKANPTKRDPDIPQRQDYLKLQNMFLRYVDRLNDLPVNMYYTALEMRRENEENDEIVIPLITGKDYQIAQYICGKMHIVGHMTAGNKRVKRGEEITAEFAREILFQHEEPYFAKDRFNALGEKMKNPTLPQIAELVYGEGEVKAARKTETRQRPQRSAERPPTRRKRSA